MVQGCVHMSIHEHVCMCLSINIGLIHQSEQHSSHHMFPHYRNFVTVHVCMCLSINIGVIHQSEQNSSHHMFPHYRNIV